MRFRGNKLFKLSAAVAGCVLLVACRKEDMSDQPKYYKPYRETDMFADGTTARPIPVGTVARGHLELEVDHYTGMVPGPDGLAMRNSQGQTEPINYIPIPIDQAGLLRGQQKFTIYCAPCHGALGDGQGMIVQRGMVPPPSLVRLDRPLTQRELNVQHAPIGHYFDVITNGYGAMYSYNERVAVDDRWRISAYIRALQLSQDPDLKVATMRTPPAGDAPVPVQAGPDAGAAPGEASPGGGAGMAGGNRAGPAAQH